jgi:hypothetical protein
MQSADVLYYAVSTHAVLCSQLTCFIIYFSSNTVLPKQMSCADIMLYINAILYIQQKRIPLLLTAQPLSLSVCRLYFFLTFSYSVVWYCVLGQSCPPFVCFSCGVFNSQEGEGADPAVRYTMLYYIMLCCAISCCAVLCYIALCCTILCYTIQCYAISYYTIMYCTILY